MCCVWYAGVLLLWLNDLYFAGYALFVVYDGLLDLVLVLQVGFLGVGLDLLRLPVLLDELLLCC